MNIEYYVIPTSNKSFTIKAKLDFLYIQTMQTKDYIVYEDKKRYFIIEKEEEDNFLKDTKQMKGFELGLKYKKIQDYQMDRINEILQEGYESTDEVFETIVKRSFGHYFSESEKYKNNISKTKEEKQVVREYFDKEIEQVKKLVINKVSELIEGSIAIKEKEKEKIKKKLLDNFEELEVNIVLSNKDSKKHSSMATPTKIQIAHDEEKIKIITKGEIENFHNDKNFQIMNKAVLIHEMGHKVGEMIGEMFGESFTVRLQSQLLEEENLLIDKEEILNYVKTSHKDSSSKNKDSANNYIPTSYDIKKSGGIRKYCEIVEKEANISRTEWIIQASGQRNTTSEIPYEYAEVYLDKELSLQDIFNSNILNNKENFGGQMSVMEVKGLEKFYSESEKEEMEKLTLIAGFMEIRDVSQVLKRKVLKKLEQGYGLSMQEYSIAEQINYEKMIDNELASRIERLKRLKSEKLKVAIYTDSKIGWLFVKLSKHVSEEKIKAMLDKYYDTMEHLKKQGILTQTYFTKYEKFKESKYAQMSPSLLAYIKQKEENHKTIKKDPFYLKDKPQIHDLKDVKITIKGKEGNDFVMQLNRLKQTYEFYEKEANGELKETKFEAIIEKETADKIYKIWQRNQGDLQKEKFNILIIKPHKLYKEVTIKSIEKQEKGLIEEFEELLYEYKIEYERGESYIEVSKKAKELLKKESFIKNEIYASNLEEKDKRKYIKIVKEYQRDLFIMKKIAQRKESVHKEKVGRDNREK